MQEINKMKINYDLELEKIISSLNDKKPNLLLHTCCAPCSSSVIERLCKYFEITVFYYNPNIEPQEEYLKRKEEQKRFLKEISKNINFLDCDYEHEEFINIAKGKEDIPEGGKRCHDCYKLRLTKTAKKAKDLSYEYFGTTLTVSPYKNSQILNQLGREIEEEMNIKYLYSDFKKKEGYKRSIVLSKEYNLYRQDYCGCKYSQKQNFEK